MILKMGINDKTHAKYLQSVGLKTIKEHALLQENYSLGGVGSIGSEIINLITKSEVVFFILDRVH